nr:MAG: major capsid protein [Microvirus Sku28]
MANIMNLTSLKNKASRGDYDLSQRIPFSAKVGEFLPLACIPVYPDDKFRLKLSNFTRTQPVETAAFTRIREYYDVFFVPYSMIWKHFDTWITSMDDNQQYASSLTKNTQPFSSLPYMTTNAVRSHLSRRKQDSTTNAKNALGYDRWQTSCKLLEYLGYGDFEEFCNDSYNGYINEKMTPFALMGYQKIYQDHLRFGQWEKYNASICNLDWVNNESQLDLDPEITARQDLFFGSSSTFFDLRYCNFERDMFFGLMPQSQYGSEAVVTLGDFNQDPNNMIELDNPILFKGVALTDEPVKVSTTGTTGKTTGNLKTSNFVDPSSLNIVLSNSVLKKLYDQVGGFSILKLRATEYLQKFKEIAQSNNPDYKAQIEAFWNCKVPVSMSNLSYRLGGYVSSLDISEVVNQNLSAEDSTADIKGLGRGTGNGFVEFDNNKFGNKYGMLFVTYHARPLLDYDLNRCEKHNKMLNVMDFPHPAFDKIGMEQLHLLDFVNNMDVQTMFKDVDPSKLFLGYAPRYIHSKTNVDVVRGAFHSNKQGPRGYEHWTAPVSSDYVTSFLRAAGVDSDKGVVYDYNVFKVNPNILDRIFLMKADSSVLTDQLLINFSMDISSVRNFDKNGMPY